MLTQALCGQTWSLTAHGPEEFDKAPLINLAKKVRACAFVVAVSSFGRSQLFRLVELEYWKKIHVVHCGVDEKFVRAVASSSQSLTIVFVGRLCEQKGQLLLVQAMNRLSEEGIDFQLRLAGDGELRAELETLIHDFGLENRVVIWAG